MLVGHMVGRIARVHTKTQQREVAGMMLIHPGPADEDPRCHVSQALAALQPLITAARWLAPFGRCAAVATASRVLRSASATGVGHG
jgi:hypothetical protein